MKSKLPIDKLIYRDVYIGGLAKDKLLKKLIQKKVGLNELAVKFINHNEFKLSPFKEKLQTVEISVSDLGFLNGSTTEEICKKSHELGFSICPHELAIHLRLQYIDLNQPIEAQKGNWQNVIIKGHFDEPGFIVGFYLRHREDGFWLRGYKTSLDYIWEPVDRFIFVKT
ncbi:MAG: hypothetical protein H0W50_04925 [Parachlamydiaceae bacterium]|nr:hypothetical protein [Parachlamydiaceae bacterium]